jgi:lipid-A-disaccharide synthase
MADDAKHKQVYFVIGEASGDALGAALMDALEQKHSNIKFLGLAGDQMQAKGLKSLFDIEQIAVMGITAVLGRLPTILSRIRDTANDIIAKNPDCVVLIDSPDFTHRVAKKVRAKAPHIPIIHYVCPSVWAWRESRAEKMTAYIDHVLAILPFEVEALKRLNGPEATYVGHPLTTRIDEKNTGHVIGEMPKLLLLPGSRSGEIKRHMPIIHDTLEVLKERGNDYELIMPVVAKHADTIKNIISDWPFDITVIEGDEAKWEAFRTADIALAASGTVSLELAISKVPTVLYYQLDPIANQFRFLLKGWSAALPNLITDRIVIPERLQEFAHPQAMVRLLERLASDTFERKTQMAGFEDVINAMKTNKPGAEIAADVVAGFLKR